LNQETRMFVRLFFLILFTASTHFATSQATIAQNDNTLPPLFDTPDFILDPGGEVLDLAFGPPPQVDSESTTLASATGNAVTLWDAKTGKKLRSVTTRNNVRRLSFTVGQRRLIAAVEPDELYIWTATLDKEIGIVKVGSAIFDFDIAPNDMVAVVHASKAGNATQTISTFYLAAALTGKLELRDLASGIALVGSSSAWSSVAFDSTGRFLAAGVRQDYAGMSKSDISKGGHVYVWDTLQGGSPRLFPTGSVTQITEIRFSPDDSLVLATSGELNVWNARNAESAYATFPGYFEGGLAVGGTFVASAEHNSGDPEPKLEWQRRRVILRNWKTGETLAVFRRAVAPAQGTPTPSAGGGGGDAGNQVVRVPVSINSDGTQLATVDPSGIISLWKIQIQPDVEPKNGVNLFAYCDALPQKPTLISSNQPITIMWSWFARTIPLVKEHWQAANYDVKLDGVVLQVSSIGPIRRDPTNNNHWTLYYRANVGTLKAGPHVITYNLTWKKRISDGFTAFGPGTTQESNTGTCQFTVK
jgi:WD40 repeat protein